MRGDWENPARLLLQSRVRDRSRSQPGQAGFRNGPDVPALLAAVVVDVDAFARAFEQAWRLEMTLGAGPERHRDVSLPLRPVGARLLWPFLVARPRMPTGIATEIPQVTGLARHVQKTDVTFCTLRAPSEFHPSRLWRVSHRARTFWWLPVLGVTAIQERQTVYPTFQASQAAG